MRDGEGARFLFRMAKAARKHWTGLAVVTQDADDVLGSDLGRAVVSNAATQILLRQAPQAIDLIAETFHLYRRRTPRPALRARGEALLAAGATGRPSAVASPREHELITDRDSAPNSSDDETVRREASNATAATALAAVTGNPAAELRPAGRALVGPAQSTADSLSRPSHRVAVVCTARALALLAAPLARRRQACRHAGRSALRCAPAAFADGARWSTILAPPTVARRAVEVLWAQLAGLLRPRWRRLLTASRTSRFEYAWAATGLSIGCGSPARSPPALVRRAVRGGLARRPHPSPTHRAAPGDAPATGGRCGWPARRPAAAHRPRRRPAAGAARRPPPAGATTKPPCVQVLARPATGAAWPGPPRGTDR